MEEEFSGPPTNVSVRCSLPTGFYLVSHFNFYLSSMDFHIFLFDSAQVVLELIMGLVLCMWAALTVPGKFMSIQPDSEENMYVLFFDLFICWI